MQLFIWADAPNYYWGSDCAVALAKNVDEARSSIVETVRAQKIAYKQKFWPELGTEGIEKETTKEIEALQKTLIDDPTFVVSVDKPFGFYQESGC